MKGLTDRQPRRFTTLPLLIAGGTVIFVFESLIPQPLPWMKMGLSNIATLLALYLFGFWEGLAVSWLRVLIGGLFSGGLFNPTFTFGIAGGGAAVMAMWLLKEFKGRFSLIGISIGGAVAHNIGQLFSAQLIFIHHSGIWKFLPFMTLTSIFTGGFTGLVAIEVLKRIKIPLIFQPFRRKLKKAKEPL
jgi:heptaprenyl diphosphate synthase